MPKTLTALLATASMFGAAACSEETQDNAAVMADRAAADAAANAEVAENAVREGAIVAADKVSEGADKLEAKLEQDERTDPDQGDGKLDGTD
ncbi:hypothetical protein [Croceicoccus bisphenolivorans]|uniref:hypothetical protein n=1 Tax=Croceicoccus bisphenolivorans TaxID=1783232 RepID=UPI000833F92D|nr:hypothetical protein [Croceicoccus bisphenolivorans]